MTNVVVTRPRSIKITANSTAGVIDSYTPVTLKNNPQLLEITGSLDKLNDINLTERVDGSTLVYDSATNVYYVKQLDMAEITGTIDGGSF